MKRTYFTLQQARLMLPTIKRYLRKAEIVRRHLLLLDSIDIHHDDLEQDDRIQRAMEKEFHYLSYLLYKQLENLDKYGVILRDLEEGLIDFRSVYEGREVYLCWHPAEKTVRFWHEIDDGYEGRKSIHELQKDLFHSKHIRKRAKQRKHRKESKKQEQKRVYVSRK